jgi:cytochrome c biogenesis protein CcmG/thiol:disulfide interchange protein DsbE
VSNRPPKRKVSSTKVAAARGSASGSRTLWIVITIAVVVLLAAVIAIAVTRSEQSVAGGGASPSGGTVVPSGDLDYGTVDVTGTPLPQMSRGAADTAVGETIPTVAGQQFDGASITIAPGGKPKIVLFVAHWCPHCQAEVPRIQEWLDENGMPSDVDLYSVATGTSSSRPNYPPGDWLREQGWSVPTMVDDEQNTASKAYGLSSYPFFVVVDATGKVVVRAAGELTMDNWETLIEAARTGTAPGGASSGESSPAS